MTEHWDILDALGNPTGRTHPRGTPTQPGEYMCIVHVWKHNGRGQWLIDKRAPRGNALDHMWETTGGCILTGETSAQAALRETYEELGLTLDPAKGQFFRRVAHHGNKTGWEYTTGRDYFIDVYVFEHDCPLSDITFQEGETTEARWTTANEIRAMQDQGTFLREGRQGDFYPYFDDMVAQFTPDIQAQL